MRVRHYITEICKKKLQYFLTLFIKEPCYILAGFFLYHFVPRKTIVLITGSMRSGTTLLKALLAEAPDISHLSEVNYSKYAKYNKYRSYCEIFSLSKKRIIVCKRHSAPPLPFDRNFIYLKIIVLTRNIEDVVGSLKKMTSLQHIEGIRRFHPSRWNNKKAVDYWCRVYEKILNDKKLHGHDIVFVKYEDLVENPKKITKELFSFIGSSQIEGVETYRKSENFEWEWGSDDGGEKIKTLKIQKCSNKPKDKELLELIKDSEEASRLMNLLGYQAKIGITK